MKRINGNWELTDEEMRRIFFLLHEGRSDAEDVMNRTSMTFFEKMKENTINNYSEVIAQIIEASEE